MLSDIFLCLSTHFFFETEGLLNLEFTNGYHG